MGRLRWLMSALAVIAVLVSQGSARGGPPRKVLGTIETVGEVSVRENASASTAELVSDPRVNLVDGNLVQTGPRAGAVLGMEREGMVGLRANSLARGLSG